jgi:hypothetical protein
MRRFLGVLAVAALVTSLPGLAQAQSLKVRVDPNGSPLNTDIHRVISDLTAQTVYLRIDSWQRFHRWDVADEFVFVLDTSGSGSFDAIVEIVPARHGFSCVVEGENPSGHLRLVGTRDASRPSQRSVACSIPRSWFPRIQRAVRFFVVTHHDRAPNRGLYIWL